MTFNLIIQNDGSVILPEPLLKYLGVDSGDELTFEIIEDGSVLINRTGNFPDFLSEFSKDLKKENNRVFEGVSSKQTIEDYIKEIREKMENE